MRITLLVNEASGSGSGPSAEDLRLMVGRAGADVTRLPVSEAARAARGGAERIVVAGGDGSVAPAAEAAAGAGVPLAVVPCGTANDFARRMGLPEDPAEACRLAATGSVTRAVDLAWMGPRPFVNVATAGLSVVAARDARPLKRALGPVAYPVGALRAAMSGSPLECAVRCDGRAVHAGPAWQVMVACSGAFGGGARIAEADPSDGRLDVVVLEAGPRRRLARHAWGLRAGRIAGRPGVRVDRGREVALSVPPGARLNVDGELVAPAGPFRVEPGRIRLVVG